MNKSCIFLNILALLYFGSVAQGQTGENVDVRSGINHDEFDRLLKEYVNEQGLVNYSGWKQNAADISTLDNYLKQFAAKIDNGAGGSRATGKPARVGEPGGEPIKPLNFWFNSLAPDREAASAAFCSSVFRE